ncbi:hypothetical protein EIJ81_00390 (plasmid) [Aliivibrio salmonicida]|uniref:hypothetical protein n=1 Tax=Aliivibrio salmonicida TaxID=40269 RepID=UPI000F6E8511|nr:hypothetical protein [Aliivibrio salmonicida]AZL83358.1 hypothetical protein EIJ81_00390 [Aliivibrio salmonicida]
MTRFVTVVYAIEDEAYFASYNDRIIKSLTDFDVDSPPQVGVCAVSMSNEVHRLELIEDALSRGDIELAKEILNASDLVECE